MILNELRGRSRAALGALSSRRDNKLTVNLSLNIESQADSTPAK